MADKELKDTVKYKIFEGFTANKCLMHEMENNFVCTPEHKGSVNKTE